VRVFWTPHYLQDTSMDGRMERLHSATQDLWGVSNGRDVFDCEPSRSNHRTCPTTGKQANILCNETLRKIEEASLVIDGDDRGLLGGRHLDVVCEVED
jgi:hypothetical protein